MEPEMTQHNGTEESQVSDSENPSVPHKTNLLPWKIMCMILAILVTIGWFGIIALLFFKEEWMLVFIACLLLYSATHFCYWYCCRHSSRTVSSQVSPSSIFVFLQIHCLIVLAENLHNKKSLQRKICQLTHQ